jgi:hypothetical protein
MNQSQKNIVIAAVIIAVLMCANPPWSFTNSHGASFSRGYGFVLDGPPDGLVADVNVQMLAIQLVVVAGGALALVQAFKDKVDGS